MIIRNNSDREWLNYNCGGYCIDIKAESEVNVSNKVGVFLLRMLGNPAWLVKVDKESIISVPIVHIDKDAVTEVTKEIEKEVKEEEIIDETPSKKVKKPVICEFCGRKNYHHRADCKRNE